jgi:hypothetical protein
MNPVQLDTSTVATDTIAYVATDQSGLTSTSTRTVVVAPPNSAESATWSTEAAPSIAPTDDACPTASTEASSPAQ